MTLGQRLKNITLANLCALLLYILSGLIILWFLSGPSLAAATLRMFFFLLTMALFAYLLIRFTYLKDGKAERQYIQSLREIGRAERGISFSEDCKLLFREETVMLILFLVINLLCWGLSCIDELLFSKQTVTMVFLIFAPMQLLAGVLPNWGYGIIGFLVSTVVDVLLYLLILLFYRKKWRTQVVGG